MRRLRVCERKRRDCCEWAGARLELARALVAGAEAEAEAPPAIIECPSCGGLLLYADEEPEQLLFRLYREGRLPPLS